MKEIDARGLACPGPVMQAKAAMEEERLRDIRIIVDNEAARQNVCRFLESQEFETSAEQDGGDFYVMGQPREDFSSQVVKEQKQETEQKKIMIMVSTDCLGHGNDALGLKLMINFITTLQEMGLELWRLVFVNNGVKLTTEGSEVLSVLCEYEKEGLHILVCGTCLTYFDLLDKKRVGETTNMLDIVTAMQLADKTINI